MSHPWTPFLTYLLHRKTRERTTVTGLPFVPALGFELEHLYLGAAKMLNHMRLYLGRLLSLTTELDAIRTWDYYWIQLDGLTFIRFAPIHDNLYSLLCPELLPSYPAYGKHRKPFTRLSHGSDLSRIPQTQSRGQRKHGSIPEHIYPATSPAGGPGHKRWSPLPPRLKPHSRSDHHRLLPPRNSRRSGPRRPVRCIYASLPHATSVPGLPSPAELSLG